MRISQSLMVFCGLFLATYPTPATAHPEVSHRIEALEDKLKSSPSSEVCAQLVELLFETKECGRGLSHGESCLRSYPNDPHLSLATARAAICTRDLNRGQELLQKLKSSQGSTLQWGYVNVYLQETRGDQTALLGAITNVIELHPSVDPHVYLRAVTLGRAIQPTQSAHYVRLLQQGISNHPKSLPLRMGLLSIQESTDNHCEALTTIDGIVREFPTLHQEQWILRRNKATLACDQQKTKN